MSVSAYCTMLYSSKYRKRKPFNPMLGETFDMVTDKFRFLSEKCQHVPVQISASVFEGKDFIMRGYESPKAKFAFNGGKGEVKI